VSTREILLLTDYPPACSIASDRKLAPVHAPVGRS